MDSKIFPAYNYIQGSTYFCVPACVQMILKRRGIAMHDEEALGVALGIVLPADLKSLIRNERFTFSHTPPPSGFGTRINLEEYSLNTFFQNYNIPLQSTYSSPSKVTDSTKFIYDSITQGNDLLVCYDYARLTNPDQQRSFGHASLIEEISNTTITLISPSAGPKRIHATACNLINAMSSLKHDERDLGGFWKISKRVI